MYIHWRARDNRSKWETEGERGGGATKTRTVFPSWLISTRFRIRTRRRLDRSCHLDSRLDGKPVVISIFHFARATRASRPPFPSQRLITTKRRFPFPPTQNFASLLVRPFFNPAPIFLFDRSISRATNRETAESGNQRFDETQQFRQIKIFFVPKRGIGPAAAIVVKVCKIDPKCAVT